MTRLQRALLTALIVAVLLALAALWAGTDSRDTLPFYDSPLEDS
jgi:hypothetical protein